MIGGRFHREEKSLERRHSEFPALDGYRAVAAFAVLTTHVAFTTGATGWPVLGPVLFHLDFGVTLFFLLSGFLLYRPWAAASLAGAKAPAFGPYLWRRALRILPAYVVMVAVTLLVLPEIQPVTAREWGANLLLLHIYVPDTVVEGLTQTWSLATEVSFYLVLPLIAWVAGRVGRGNPERSARYQVGVLVAVALVSIPFRLALKGSGYDAGGLAGFWLPGFLDWFALGMICAVVRERIRFGGAGRGWTALREVADDSAFAVAAGVLLFLLACTPLGGPYELVAGSLWQDGLKHSLYGFAALLLLLPGFLSTRQNRITGTLAHPAPRFLGEISYGVFLWHLVLLRLLVDLLDIQPFSGGFAWVWTVTVLLTIVAATASFRWVELPAQRFRRLRRRAAADDGSPHGEQDEERHQTSHRGGRPRE
ncbi:MAG: acyltransferase [Candidatus Nanopelagicales bacterium]